MARWIAVHGEGIFGTRPWRVAGEGPSLAPESGSFKEAEQAWTSQDFRFTAKGDALYAFQMAWPDDGKAAIRSLAAGGAPKVSEVRLLGADQPVPFAQTAAGLEITLPGSRVGDYAHCFRCTLR
jgi:alpha-L-fucosidase